MPGRRTTTIGTAEFRADCPVPPVGIGFWEAIALTTRGWLDAGRNRLVPDTHHTHSLHRLVSRHRLQETHANLRIRSVLSNVELEMARLEFASSADVPVTREAPNSEDLADLPDDAHAVWAQRVRAARALQQRAAAVRDRKESALIRTAELERIHSSLQIEADEVRRLWSEAYTMRAARYTRARFGRRGAPVNEMPHVAEYRPISS